MAELKLIEIRDRKDFYYWKIYKYGQFKVIVDIDDNRCKIEAEDENKNFNILAIDKKPAILSFSMAMVTSKNADKFLELVNQGTELLKIIDERREELIKKETK